MAETKFEIGSSIVTISPKEMTDILADRAQADLRQVAEGKKYARLNPPVTGVAAAGVLRIGGDYINAGPAGTAVAPPQPRAGYCWAMRRMAVRGLTNGATPDVVNLFRSMGDAQAYVPGGGLSGGDWQFNGNNFAYTFSFGELVFFEGETPVLVSQGAFAAVGQITLRADFVEVPQVLLWKVLG